MNISKKNIYLVAMSVIIASYCSEQPNPKIDPKNMGHFGLRYLDCLEYSIPEQELGNATEKNPNPRFNPQKYVADILRHYQAPVFIALINNDIGYGVFAEQDIKKGQMIGEYTGIVKKVNFSNKKEDYDYAWGFPPPTKFLIDATEAGNFTRFINHCNQHNVDMVYVPINNHWHLVYVANQDIKKNEQLRANYGKPYWNGRGIRPCELKNRWYTK